MFPPRADSYRALVTRHSRVWLLCCRVVDVSDPSSPTSVGFLTFSSNEAAWFGRSIVLQDPYAYVAADDGTGLWIADVSSATTPSVVGHLPMSGQLNGIAVDGSRADVAVGKGGLSVGTVSKPSAPSWIGSFAARGEALGVSLMGRLAYVAAGEGGLQVVEVANGGHMAVVGAYPTGGLVTDVTLANGYVYVAYAVLGLFILRFSDK